MSRPTHPRIKLWLAVLLLTALACDASSLGLSGSQSSGDAHSPTQFPNSYAAGTAGVFRPSAAGWIAFINQGNLWLIHPDGSGPKQITDNPVPSTPAPEEGGFRLRWSPDGHMLAYSKGGVLSLLDITSLATTVLARNTAGGFDWSPDATQIVYDGSLAPGQSGQQANRGLTIIDVTSKKAVPVLKSSTAYPAILSPRWSSDASHLIFSGPTGAQPSGLHLMDLQSDKISDILPGSSKESECSWSPGKLLIACVDPNPPPGQAPSVVFLNQNGSETLAVALPAAHFHPRLGPWSSDGARLAISYSTDASDSQAMTDILTLESSMFKTLGPGRAADWSSDGRWVVLDGAPASGAQAERPITVINTTSGLTSSLSNGSSAAWQPGVADVTGAPTQAFCMDTTAGFVHNKPKGYSLKFCVGAQRYEYPSLEKGVYAVGPGAKFFVYTSNSGFVFAARMGDSALTHIGDVREFIVIHTEGMEPSFQIRFLTGYPNLVQIVELVFHQNETFTIPSRIVGP